MRRPGASAGPNHESTRDSRRPNRVAVRSLRDARPVGPDHHRQTRADRIQGCRWGGDKARRPGDSGAGCGESHGTYGGPNPGCLSRVAGRSGELRSAVRRRSGRCWSPSSAAAGCVAAAGRHDPRHGPRDIAGGKPLGALGSRIGGVFAEGDHHAVEVNEWAVASTSAEPSWRRGSASGVSRTPARRTGPAGAAQRWASQWRDPRRCRSA